jgi:hypothetical protein
MKQEAMILLSLLLGLWGACGSKSGNPIRDSAVDVGIQAGGGGGGTGVAGNGGTSVVGTGGTGVVGSGGVALPGTGGAGTGGVSAGSGGSTGAGGGGSGGTGTPSDGGTPAIDTGIDGNAAADVVVSNCEKNGDTCVPLTGGCAVCPDGSYAKWSSYGCPSGSWCCTQDTPGDSPCEQGGGICGSSSPSCPAGWMAMRTSCGTSSAMCCSPQGDACRAVLP